MLEQTVEGRRLLEVSRLSPLEFVESEFENPVIQAGLLFFNGLREVDLRAPGFGHHIPALLASRHKAQMCIGGSAELAKALGAAIDANRRRHPSQYVPKRIVIENNRAVGVETTDGSYFRARHFVASGLNPMQTFVELIEEGCLALPSGERRPLPIEFNLLAPLFALNVNLKEAPRYMCGGDGIRTSGEAFMTILGLEDSAQFNEIVSRHESGAHSVDGDVGILSNAVRSISGSSRYSYGVHVGETSI